MQEIWKKATGFDNYEISDLGNLRSIDRYEKFKGSLRLRKGRNMRTRIFNGYYTCSLSDGAKQKTVFIHRMVAQAFCNNPENKPNVNHKDANRLNNRWDNLEWVTQAENIEHAMQLESWTKGENHGNAVLKDEDVRYIKAQEKGSIALAKQFSVSYATIKKIRCGKHWKHIK
jgi:hypothetical protein